MPDGRVSDVCLMGRVSDVCLMGRVSDVCLMGGVSDVCLMHASVSFTMTCKTHIMQGHH